MKKPGEKPAFPLPIIDHYETYSHGHGIQEDAYAVPVYSYAPGMTHREVLMALAMAAWIASPGTTGTPAECARQCRMFVDEILASEQEGDSDAIK